MIKTLITADDFGFTHNVNRAIIEAYEKGRITEPSLMVDSHGTDEAVQYIKNNKVRNVGLHFSLNRLSRDHKTLQGKEYDRILESWNKEQLIQAFEEEVKLFQEKLGFSPSHIIGHKQIALHPKLVDYVADYCISNNCYIRKEVTHKTLQASGLAQDKKMGRTVDVILAFHYGSPEEMYKAYKQDIRKAKEQEKLQSIEMLFHPGYADDFERALTSFIQERIDDINFLLSDYFLILVQDEDLELVPSSEI